MAPPYTRSFFRYRCLSAIMKIINGIIFVKDELEVPRFQHRNYYTGNFHDKEFSMEIIAIKNNRTHPEKILCNPRENFNSGDYECRF